MATSFLFDGDDTAPVTILLAHGAGASMDSPSMTATAKALAAAGFQVARFEFSQDIGSQLVEWPLDATATASRRRAPRR